jgi:hypothetical protein
VSGEESEPSVDERAKPPDVLLRKVLVDMAIIIIAGAAIGFVFFSPKVGFGVLVGGCLAFANYFWQKHSLKAIFDRAVHGQKTPLLAVRYILRYVVIGGVLLLIYLSDVVSIIAVVFGLASFAIAVTIEGLRGMVTNSFKREV